MEHAFGLDIPSTLEEVCDPRQTALLVYDMQVGILSQLADAATIKARVLDVLSAAREAKIRTIFLRYMTLPPEMEGVVQLRTAMAWQRADRVSQLKSPFLRDSRAFELIPEVVPLKSEVVFDRISMSAFVGTPVDTVLRDCGVKSFAIVGAALEVGIEPTVHHAMDLGYVPVVVTDACGSGNQAARERSLASLAWFGGSFQTNSGALRDIWGRARKRIDLISSEAW
jgi:nicotinamidase-related amidase